MANAPIFISVVEAGRMLGIGRSRVYELLSQDRLTAVRLGGRRLVKVESIHALAAALEAEASANVAA